MKKFRVTRILKSCRNLSFEKPTNFLLLISLFLVGKIEIHAQTLTVRRFEQVNEISALQYPRKDANGEVCALVKVEVMDSLIRVEGGAVGAAEDHGNEKWVYLLNGQREFKLHFANHLPVRVSTRDYVDICSDGLQGGTTYVLTLIGTLAESVGPEVTTMTQMQTLTVNYCPADAELSLNGTVMNAARGGVFVATLPVGTYRLVVSKGKETSDEIIRLFSSTPQKLTIDLTRKDNVAEDTLSKSDEEQLYNLALAYIKEGKDAQAESLSMKYLEKYDIFIEILETLRVCGFYDEHPEKWNAVQEYILKIHSQRKHEEQQFEAPTFRLG